MKLFRLNEVSDPHEMLRATNDKLIGFLIRGEFEEDYLLCIATDDSAPYYGDDDFRGQSDLLIYNPGLEEIDTSFNENSDAAEKSLEYLRTKVGLNKFELNELFGHDGPSSGLVEHISKLVATLPPDADECLTDSDANECTVSDGRTIIRNIIARHGNGKPMELCVFDDDNILTCRAAAEETLEHLESIDPAEQWLIDTGDGHINPVVRIAPHRNLRTGEYVVGVWFDSMLEYGDEE